MQILKFNTKIGWTHQARIFLLTKISYYITLPVQILLPFPPSSIPKKGVQFQLSTTGKRSQ